MLGFMPLKSYLNHKDIKASEKTPADKEDLVRAYSLMKALEDLKCTKVLYEEASAVVKDDKDSFFEQLDEIGGE